MAAPRTLTYTIGSKDYTAEWMGEGNPTTQELDEIEGMIYTKYGLNKPQAQPLGAKTGNAKEPYGNLGAINKLKDSYHAVFGKDAVAEQYSGKPRNIGATNVPSLHNTGEALDLRNKDLQGTADWAIRQPGVRTVIYNRKIWHPDTGWKDYNVKGGNPHTDHVHVDYGRKKAAVKREEAAVKPLGAYGPPKESVDDRSAAKDRLAVAYEALFKKPLTAKERQRLTTTGNPGVRPGHRFADDIIGTYEGTKWQRETAVPFLERINKTIANVVGGSSLMGALGDYEDRTIDPSQIERVRAEEGRLVTQMISPLETAQQVMEGDDLATLTLPLNLLGAAGTAEKIAGKILKGFGAKQIERKVAAEMLAKAGFEEDKIAKALDEYAKSIGGTVKGKTASGKPIIGIKSATGPSGLDEIAAKKAAMKARRGAPKVETPKVANEPKLSSKNTKKTGQNVQKAVAEPSVSAQNVKPTPTVGKPKASSTPNPRESGVTPGVAATKTSTPNSKPVGINESVGGSGPSSGVGDQPKTPNLSQNTTLPPIKSRIIKGERVYFFEDAPGMVTKDKNRLPALRGESTRLAKEYSDSPAAWVKQNLSQEQRDWFDGVWKDRSAGKDGDVVLANLVESMKSGKTSPPKHLLTRAQEAELDKMVGEAVNKPPYPDAEIVRIKLRENFKPAASPKKSAAIKAQIDAKKASMKARNKRLPKTAGGSPITKEDFKDLGELAVLHGKYVGASAKEFVEDIVKDFGEAWRVHAQKAWDDVHGPEPKANLVESPSSGQNPIVGINKGDRSARGMDVVSTKGMKHADLQAKADEILAKGDFDPDAEFADLANKGRPASALDFAIGRRHATNLVNERGRLEKLLDGTLTDAKRAEIADAYQKHLQRIDDFDANVGSVTSATGESLGSLRIGQTVNWSDIKDVNKYRDRIGLPELAGADRKAYEKAVADAETFKANFEKAQKNASSAKADAVLQSWARAARSGNVEKIRTARAQAVNALKEELKKAKFGVGTPSGGGAFQGLIEAAPEVVKQIGVILKTYVDEFQEISAAKLSVRLAQEAPDLGATEDDVRAILAGVYDESQGVRPQSFWQQARSQAKAELNAADAGLIKARNAELAAGKRKVKRLEERLTKIDSQENQLRSGITIAPTKRVKQTSSEEAFLDRLIKANEKKIRAMAKENTQTWVGKTRKLVTSNQLLNPIARVVDLASNATKMAAYQVQNPLRSLMQVGVKGVGKEHIMSIPKAKNVFSGYGSRVWKEIKYTLKGYDMDTLTKYGNPGLGTRVAGTTDVPFRDIYYRMVADDFAVDHSKVLATKMNLPQKELRQTIFKQITEGKDGPLTLEEVEHARAMAHDWGMRQTFNADNYISEILEGGRGGAIAKMRSIGRSPAEIEAFEFGADVFTRFNRIITNVVLDRVNSTPAGIFEGAVRLLTKKGQSVEGVKLASDLISKGLTGTGLFVFGYYNPEIFEKMGIVRTEVVTTKHGSKFVKVTLFPQIGGGIELSQTGGFVPPYLIGATVRKIQNSGMKAKQKEDVITKLLIDAYASTPLTTNVSDMVAVGKGEKTVGQYVGNQAARQFLPGSTFLNEVATRMDESRTGVRVRKTKSAKDEFQKRIPILREQLPSNQGSVTRLGGF